MVHELWNNMKQAEPTRPWGNKKIDVTVLEKSKKTWGGCLAQQSNQTGTRPWISHQTKVDLQIKQRDTFRFHEKIFCHESHFLMCQHPTSQCNWATIPPSRYTVNISNKSRKKEFQLLSKCTCTQNSRTTRLYCLWIISFLSPLLLNIIAWCVCIHQQLWSFLYNAQFCF